MNSPLRPVRKRHLYGRRLGKKLRPGQQALYDRLLPKFRIPLPDAASEPIAIDKLFDRSLRKYWLEIGFGGGEHLVHQATMHADTGFLGCEPFINGTAKLLRQINESQLVNIRIHDGDAGDLLAVLPDASIDRIYLLYPDPWPKRRHHKRRFIQNDTLDRLAQAMTNGAELRIATDFPGYVDWMLIHLHANEQFEWLADCANDWRRPFSNWPGTRYEAKALRQGRKPVYLTFRRRIAMPIEKKK